MRMAAIQMTTGPDSRANLTQARALLEEAVGKGCDLVAFPELFNLLSPQARQTMREAIGTKNPLLETLSEWAIEQDAWILAGSLGFKPKNARKLQNLSLLFSPEGEIVARYAKIHLFDASVPGDAHAYRESSLFQAGKKIVTARIRSEHTGETFTAGLSVCYDLRFPELYRRMNSPDVIFAPSAFTAVTGLAHWDTLTRARAIENQAYVIAPAQVGSAYPGRECYGHTRIVDPWGRVIAERPRGPGVVWADVRLSQVEEVRSKIPALQAKILI